MEKAITVEEVNIKLSEIQPPKQKRGGHRPGAGRPSLVRENKKRMEMGLEPLLPNKKINKKAVKSNAILPESKKARHQEILAEMLGRKSQYIVQKVLDKALDDEDADQMACLKLVMDRVLPADYLTKIKKGSNAIQINITGVGQAEVVGETIDNEVEYEEDDE